MAVVLHNRLARLERSAVASRPGLADEAQQFCDWIIQIAAQTGPLGPSDTASVNTAFLELKRVFKEAAIERA